MSMKVPPTSMPMVTSGAVASLIGRLPAADRTPCTHATSPNLAGTGPSGDYPPRRRSVAMSRRLIRTAPGGVSSAVMRIVALLLALLLAACGGAPPVATLSQALREHDLLLKPAGDGPFPAVIVLSTCVGNLGDADRWAERLKEAGYVALVVNSLRQRGMENVVGRVRACRGDAHRGEERAVDVLVSLAYLRGLPYVDAGRLAVLGFSHGGWSALELLGLQPGPDVRAAAPDGLAGLRAVGTVYPFCARRTIEGTAHWPAGPAVQLLLAGEDRTVGVEPCLELAERARKLGHTVDLHVFAGAGHGFDIPPELSWGFGSGRYLPAAAMESRHRILDFLGTYLR